MTKIILMISLALIVQPSLLAELQDVISESADVDVVCLAPTRTEAVRPGQRL